MPCICFPQRYVQCRLVLYLQSKCLNISGIYPGKIPFQYLKMVFAINYSTLPLTGSQFIFLKWVDWYEISEVNLGKNEYICLSFLKYQFSLKEEIMKNILNQNVTELAHPKIVFYTQGLGTCFGDTGILVQHLLF